MESKLLREPLPTHSHLLPDHWFEDRNKIRNAGRPMAVKKVQSHSLVPGGLDQCETMVLQSQAVGRVALGVWPSRIPLNAEAAAAWAVPNQKVIAAHEKVANREGGLAFLKDSFLTRDERTRALLKFRGWDGPWGEKPSLQPNLPGNQPSSKKSSTSHGKRGRSVSCAATFPALDHPLAVTMPVEFPATRSRRRLAPLRGPTTKCGHVPVREPTRLAHNGSLVPPGTFGRDLLRQVDTPPYFRHTH